MRLLKHFLAIAMAGAGLGVDAQALPGPFPIQVAPQQTLHVATNGSNATGNGSLAQPFRTVQRAGLAAVPGTEILVHPGTYSGGEYINDLQGVSTNPIWIRGVGITNRPLFSGAAEGFHFTRARYVWIENIEVANATANGINCDDGGDYGNEHASGFLVFSNIVIRDIGTGGNQDGLKLSGIRDFYVYNAEITRCGGSASGSAIDMVGCHRGLIQGGSFYDLSANAIQVKGGSTDIEIRQCIISNAGHRAVNIGGSTSFEFFRPPLQTNTPAFEAANIRLYSSIIIGSTASVAFVGCVDSVAANNTLIEPTRWVFRVLQETTSSSGYTFLPCASNRFENNIVYYHDGLLNQYANVGADTLPNSFMVRNNLWFPYDNPGANPYSLPGIVTNNRYGLNPQFMNTAARDYRITVTSPAATNGFGMAGAADFAGYHYLLPPSRGAFEITGDVDGNGLPDYWELTHFSSTGQDAGGDPDGDGFTNTEEWRADTDPTNAWSRLVFTSLRPTGTGLELEWTGGSAAVQYLETTSWDGENWNMLLSNQPPTQVTNRIDAVETSAGAVFRIRAHRE